MANARIEIPRTVQTIALYEHINGRINDLRKELEDERLDERHNDTVRTRARINELKDILDRFRFPDA